MDDDLSEILEIGYLGCGASLTVGGLQLPNGRVADVLNDAGLMKALLLVFDYILISGSRIVVAENEKAGLIPWPERSTAEFQSPDVQTLNRLRCSTEVDAIAAQLMEVGAIRFVDSVDLFTDTETMQLLEAFIDFACKVADGSKNAPPLTWDEAVALDPGPLGPWMREDLVVWVMEELQHLRLAIVESTGPLFSYENPHGQVEYSGESLMFGVGPYMADIFSLAANQLIRMTSSRLGLGLHPLRAGHHTIGSGWTSRGADLPGLADLILLEASITGLRLDSAPLDEILDFRNQNTNARRVMLRRLRTRLAELTTIPDRFERRRQYLEYYAELDEAAQELASAGRRAFGRGTRDVALGGASIGVGFATGNPLASLIGLAQTMHSVEGRRTHPHSFLSYFFNASRSISYQGRS